MVTFTGDVPPLVSHSAHPEHALKLVATGGELFQCDGCRLIDSWETDQERRYRCEQCEFDLHICCARAPVSFEHPMFQGRALTFLHRRPSGSAWCDVCGNQVLGFLYHNHEHGMDIHPPCAILPERVVLGDGRVMELHRAAGHECVLCRQDGHRGRFLAYRLQNDDGEVVYLHVACMIENFGSDGQAVHSNSQMTGELATPQSAPTTGQLATPQSAPTTGQLATLRIAQTTEEMLAALQIKPTTEEMLAALQSAPTTEEMLATLQIEPTTEEMLVALQSAPTTEEMLATLQIEPTTEEMLAALQDAPMRKRDIFFKVVSITARVSLALANLDPVGAIAEIAS